MDVATIDLNIGNTQRGFSYRRSTADEGLIAQVLMDSCFNFSRLRRLSLMWAPISPYQSESIFHTDRQALSHGAGG